MVFCGRSENISIYKNELDSSTDKPINEAYTGSKTLIKITVTADDKQFDGVLFDNETARLFAEKLPLTVDLCNPVPGFAKAFDLEEAIPDI